MWGSLRAGRCPEPRGFRQLGVGQYRMHVEVAEARWPTHYFGQARRELRGRRIALLFHRLFMGGKLNDRYVSSGAIAVFSDRRSRSRQYAWMLISKPLQCHRDRINVGRLKLDELNKPCHIPPPLRSSYRLTRYDLGKIPARRPRPSGEAGTPGLLAWLHESPKAPIDVPVIHTPSCGVQPGSIAAPLPAFWGTPSLFTTLSCNRRSRATAVAPP